MISKHQYYEVNMDTKDNKTKPMGRKNFPLRLSDELRKRLKILAAETDRSMNDLIIAAIERSYPPQPKSGKDV
jgi:predicted HicB family RNase H-like nuclease